MTNESAVCSRRSPHQRLLPHYRQSPHVQAPPGSPLHTPAPPARCRVHRLRNRNLGSRHWRQRHGLQRGLHAAAAPAAIRAARPTRLDCEPRDAGPLGQTTQVGHMLDLRERSETLSAVTGYFAFYGVGDSMLTGRGAPRAAERPPGRRQLLPGPRSAPGEQLVLCSCTSFIFRSVCSPGALRGPGRSCRRPGGRSAAGRSPAGQHTVADAVEREVACDGRQGLAALAEVEHVSHLGRLAQEARRRVVRNPDELGGPLEWQRAQQQR